MKKNFLSIVTFISMSGFLSACEMFSAVSSPAQERGMSGFLSDNALRFKVNGALVSGQGLEQVEIIIHRGRILLLGVVDKEVTKTVAVSKIKKITGVKDVIDEIQVGHESFSDYSRDAWIGHKLRALLFFDSRVYSQNYHLRVSNKIVYILGTSQNQAEKAFVIEQDESLPVRRVVTYIDILPPMLQHPSPQPAP
jgi:osmotically-inducible protein OsmY